MCVLGGSRTFPLRKAYIPIDVKRYIFICMNICIYMTFPRYDIGPIFLRGTCIRERPDYSALVMYDWSMYNGHVKNIENRTTYNPKAVESFRCIATSMCLLELSMLVASRKTHTKTHKILHICVFLTPLS